MRLIVITYFAVCINRINAFVPWRPNTSDFDPSTLHSIEASSHAVRRHKLRIAHASAKFERRTGTGKLNAASFSPLTRREDKTSGPVDLYSDPNDISYWVNVDVGSSGKSFRLVVDTGSADTWIPSTECKSKSCLAHRTFGPDDSSTLHVTSDKTFAIAYASGNVEGYIAKDTLKFGSVTIDKMEFGLAKMVSDDFTNFPVDGILGLGFPSASILKVPTFIENLISHNVISKHIFGAYLHRTADNKNGGTITFGGIDASRIEGGVEALKYYDVNTTTSLWSIRLSDVVLDGQNANFQEGRNVIIDTGTALILIPPEDALKLHQFIPGTKSNGETFYIPCSTDISLQFQFGNDAYQLSGKDYVGDPIDAQKELCLSLIVGRSVVRDGAWLIGDVFLRNVYSVFDMENGKIGFGIPVPAVRASSTSMEAFPSSSSDAVSDTIKTALSPVSTFATHDSSTVSSAIMPTPIPTSTSTSGQVNFIKPTGSGLPDQIANSTSSPIRTTTAPSLASSNYSKEYRFQALFAISLFTLHNIIAITI
ncbi:hypothetical protein TWF569_011461 [Orbilia oligospora]|uniref:Peptidase A1 domain-containing protein n=2 Tax=Orbilia oligospora TaxID=2813651 RepID=A0A7C8NMA8_ORBOL|nr:hypothetical protein TWF103_009264 [Orbilia oligospora]KAF3123432.1 hypothetical protein TWF703_000908 [Orbilia oligospora]KAF3131151.1 hypothetical protein TWF569_011461 [Orbilia oligospora]KAF3131741.1 hypothetical protein TWF594_009764 [Orbilia oligospora]